MIYIDPFDSYKERPASGRASRCSQSVMGEHVDGVQYQKPDGKWVDEPCDDAIACRIICLLCSDTCSQARWGKVTTGS